MIFIKLIKILLSEPHEFEVVYNENRMSSIDINSFCVHVSLNGSVQ